VSTVGSAAPSRTGHLVLLVDGTTALIRPLDPGDRDAVLDLHDRASDDSLYKRFFSAGRGTAHAFVDRLFVAGNAIATLVAVRHGQVIGIATAIDTEQGEAEVALLVDEALHGVGVGTRLLEELARDARRRGLLRFTADVLTQNSAMLRVFHDLGFALREQRDHDVLLLTMDLTLRPSPLPTRDTAGAPPARCVR
jgi:GNAT superfamily N-acetyltransferase